MSQKTATTCHVPDPPAKICRDIGSTVVVIIAKDLSLPISLGGEEVFYHHRFCSEGDLCRDWGSDPGHHNFQSCALPTELSRQKFLFVKLIDFTQMHRACQALLANYKNIDEYPLTFRTGQAKMVEYYERVYESEDGR